MPASSPLLLALTTATDACGVAVWQSEQLQSELTLHRPRRHGQRLVPLARDALAHAEADADALDAVALAAGPGSYTGLRIGASGAKGLCRATGAALMPVPTLAALAEATRPFAPQDVLLGAALTSRRGEVYTATFRCEGNALAPLQASEALESDEAAQQFRRLLRAEPDARPLWLVGSGAGRVAEALDASATERPAAQVVEKAWPTAGTVARLGAARLATGEPAPADAPSFEPRYLKPVHAKPPRQSAFEGLS
jgi:tRNA threonylcarbamoyladenosine biosynthesis protein TsaB